MESVAGSGRVRQGGSVEVGMGQQGLTGVGCEGVGQGRHGSARVDRGMVRRGRARSEGVGQGRSAGVSKGLQGLVRVARGWQGSGERTLTLDIEGTGAI